MSLAAVETVLRMSASADIIAAIIQSIAIAMVFHSRAEDEVVEVHIAARYLCDGIPLSGMRLDCTPRARTHQRGIALVNRCVLALRQRDRNHWGKPARLVSQASRLRLLGCHLIVSI